MYTATRFPMERIAVIDKAIRSGEFPNAQTIADRLGVSRRTVLRDIEFLCERLGAPVVYDAKRRGFTYSDPNYRLPSQFMTEGELLALMLAERVLRQYRGTPYGPDLARAVRKISEGLTDVLTVDLSLLADSCSFRTTASEPFEPEIFVRLTAAIRGHRRIALQYWTASRDEETRREVDPYHLACVDGHWYLVGHCHLRNDIRMFAPGRIRSLAQTDETFDLPGAFKIDEYLGRSFAVFRGDGDESHRVRLRFRGEAVKYVRERPWHQSQVLTPTDDGGLVVEFELSHLREVERWVLSWGSDCTVIEPAALRERVRIALADSLTNYSSGERPRGRGCNSLSR